MISRFGISVIPLNIIFEKNNEVYKVWGQEGELSMEDFYKKLEKELPTTGMPESKVFHKPITKATEEAESVIVITTSSKLSKIHLHAKATISGIHGKDITLVDSAAGGSTLGLLVLEVAKMAQNGASKEVLSRINALKPKIVQVSVIDDMTNIYRAGRTSFLRKQLGKAMKMKPILLMEHGNTSSGGTFRGREHVI